MTIDKIKELIRQIEAIYSLVEDENMAFEIRDRLDDVLSALKKEVQ